MIDNNDWRVSIRNQGVMTEVWLAATTFEHDDGTPNVTIPVTAEGSSRVTCVHDLLELRSADVPYARDERKLRSHIRKLNDEVTAAGRPDEVDPDVAIKVRCEKVPALLLVGFEPHRGTGGDFGVAVKSLVALRHVDSPKPWGEATENKALADAVIDELDRRGLITTGKADWLSRALTPNEAEAAGFNRDPAIRAATITRLFTDRDPQTYAAIRVAITSQSTRSRITTKLLLDVATSLILRSLPEEDARRRERTRKYLKDALSGELAKEWDATLRMAEELAAAAHREVAAGDPRPATRELAARSAYPLIVGGALTADRGTRNSDQPDRRHPGEVIDRMDPDAYHPDDGQPDELALFRCNGCPARLACLAPALRAEDPDVREGWYGGLGPIDRDDVAVVSSAQSPSATCIGSSPRSCSAPRRGLDSQRDRSSLHLQPSHCPAIPPGRRLIISRRHISTVVNGREAKRGAASTPGRTPALGPPWPAFCRTLRQKSGVGGLGRE